MGWRGNSGCPLFIWEIEESFAFKKEIEESLEGKILFLFAWVE